MPPMLPALAREGLSRIWSSDPFMLFVMFAGRSGNSLKPVVGKDEVIFVLPLSPEPDCEVSEVYVPWKEGAVGGYIGIL